MMKEKGFGMGYGLVVNHLLKFVSCRLFSFLTPTCLLRLPCASTFNFYLHLFRANSLSLVVCEQAFIFVDLFVIRAHPQARYASECFYII